MLCTLSVLLCRLSNGKAQAQPAMHGAKPSDTAMESGPGSKVTYQQLEPTMAWLLTGSMQVASAGSP